VWWGWHGQRVEEKKTERSITGALGVYRLIIIILLWLLNPILHYLVILISWTYIYCH
jgi:hypothetical protein